MRVCIGRILSPLGLKGEVKVKLFADSLDLFDSPVESEKGELLSLSLKTLRSKRVVIATVKDIKDRTAAEQISGTNLFVDRSKLPVLPEGEYYYEDLVGLQVLDEDQKLVGLVKGVFNYGGGEFLEIQDDTEKGKIYTLLFRDKGILFIDLEHRILVAQHNSLIF